LVGSLIAAGDGSREVRSYDRKKCGERVISENAAMEVDTAVMFIY
jgi:hypothetical protein